MFTRYADERLRQLPPVSQAPLLTVERSGGIANTAGVLCRGTTPEIGAEFAFALIVQDRSSETSRAGEELAIRRLSDQEVVRLLELLAGTRPSRALVGAIQARTAGKPDLVIELLHGAWAEGGPLVPGVWAVLEERAGGTTDRAVFRREGDYWTIIYEGAVARLRHARGFHYLALLLRHPGQRLRAADLVGQAGRGSVVHPERARLAVTKAIGAALARIDAVLPDLGQHLRTTVRRGYLCSYTPDPRRMPRWSA